MSDISKTITQIIDTSAEVYKTKQEIELIKSGVPNYIAEKISAHLKLAYMNGSADTLELMNKIKNAKENSSLQEGL